MRGTAPAASPASPDDARALLDRWLTDWAGDGLGYWAVTLAATKGTVGIGALSRRDIDGEPSLSVYYRLAPTMWGRGYTAELVSGAAAWGFRGLT